MRRDLEFGEVGCQSGPSGGYEAASGPCGEVGVPVRVEAGDCPVVSVGEATGALVLSVSDHARVWGGGAERRGPPDQGTCRGDTENRAHGVRGARPPAPAWVGAAGVEGVAGQPAGRQTDPGSVVIVYFNIVSTPAVFFSSNAPSPSSYPGACVPRDKLAG